MSSVSACNLSIGPAYLGKYGKTKSWENVSEKERLNISICHGFNYISLNDNSENLFSMLNTSAKGRVPKDPASTSKYEINTGGLTQRKNQKLLDQKDWLGQLWEV